MHLCREAIDLMPEDDETESSRLGKLGHMHDRIAELREMLRCDICKQASTTSVVWPPSATMKDPGTALCIMGLQV